MCNISFDWHRGFSGNSRGRGCGRIPTEKGRQFDIQRLKENRKTALANLTKQINVILPLLADFENEKQVRIEVVQLDQLFVKMQEVHDMYLSALDARVKLN